MSEYFNSPLIIFDEENEAELINEFVRLSARYKNTQYGPEQICQLIFKNLRSPDRYITAATVWGNDIEIAERINDLIQGKTEGEDQQTVYLTKLEAWADNPTFNLKERIAAVELAAKIRGYIKKEVTKNIKNTGNTERPVFLFREYNEATDGNGNNTDEAAA